VTTNGLETTRGSSESLDPVDDPSEGPEGSETLGEGPDPPGEGSDLPPPGVLPETGDLDEVLREDAEFRDVGFTKGTARFILRFT
jgi:hypothetical protein